MVKTFGVPVKVGDEFVTGMCRQNVLTCFLPVLLLIMCRKTAPPAVVSYSSVIDLSFWCGKGNSISVSDVDVLIGLL